MKIVFLTPGTGSYYCGACLRDNMLARELHRLGHDVTILPMYLPLELDDASLPNAGQTPVFFGGINVYLQQKLGLFRKTPAFLDRLLNSPGLLRWAARHSHMTSAREHGEMTLEMLNVETSRLRKETEKLFAWLETTGKPEIVCLSTTLLAGFAAEIKRRLGVPVISFFQGEDSFLDGLPEPYRSQSWQRMREQLDASDAVLAPSRYYAEFMRERLGPAARAIEVVHNGVALEGYTPAAPADPASPVIGYFARMTRDKGLELFVDAFIALAREHRDTTTRARIGGAATAGDQALIVTMQRRLQEAGLADRVQWSPNLSRTEKIAFLRSLSLFSVPAVYREAFGLYVVEAMACSVPVVQPESSAFPELIGLGGGGVCVPPRDPRALARAWRDLLADPARRATLGREARLSVEKHLSAATMCASFCQVTDRLVRATA